MNLRNPHNGIDKKLYIRRYRCWYCKKGARRMAGRRPICGFYKHYSQAVVDHYKEKNETRNSNETV